MTGAAVAALPALLILGAYGASFAGLGVIMHRLFGLSKAEGFFVATPAGASDIALVMDDLGMSSARVMIIQVVRLIAVLALFPQAVNVALFLDPLLNAYAPTAPPVPVRTSKSRAAAATT